MSRTPNVMGYTPERALHNGIGLYGGSDAMRPNALSTGYPWGPDSKLQRDMRNTNYPLDGTRVGGNEPSNIPTDNSVIAHTLNVSPRTRDTDVTEGQITFIYRDPKVKSRDGDMRVIGLSRLNHSFAYGENRVKYDHKGLFPTGFSIMRDLMPCGIMGRYQPALTGNASRNNRIYTQLKLAAVMETPNIWIVNDNTANSNKRTRAGSIRARKDDMAIEGHTLYLLLKRVHKPGKFSNIDGIESAVSEYHWVIEPWSSNVYTHRPPDVLFNNFNDDTEAGYRGGFWKIGYLMERWNNPAAGHCSGQVEKTKKAIYPTAENDDYLKAFNMLPKVRIAWKYS